jgi:hypothetical protein
MPDLKPAPRTVDTSAVKPRFAWSVASVVVFLVVVRVHPGGARAGRAVDDLGQLVAAAAASLAGWRWRHRWRATLTFLVVAHSRQTRHTRTGTTSASGAKSVVRDLTALYRPIITTVSLSPTKRSGCISDPSKPPEILAKTPRTIASGPTNACPGYAGDGFGPGAARSARGCLWCPRWESLLFRSYVIAFHEDIRSVTQY